MSTYGNWETKSELGEGGQGKVYLARKLDGNSRIKLLREWGKYVKQMTAHIGLPDDQYLASAELMLERLSQLMPNQHGHSTSLGALKVLKTAEESPEYKKAKIRMKNEVVAYRQLNHP